MLYEILAGVVIFLHFLWILFIISGFILTVFFWKKFFDKFVLRTIHLLSILYTSYLEITGRYCPLTIIENYLKTKSDKPPIEVGGYTGSFIVHYIEKLVYPDVEPLIVIIPTIIIGIIILVMFILKPPGKIKEIICRK